MNLQRALAISFFLFVVSTMISQSAMDAFATLSGIFLVARWFQLKKSFQLFPQTGLELPFLAFSVAVILSFVANWETQTLVVQRVLELKWILNFYLIFAALRVLNPDWKSFQRVQIFIFISAAFALLSPIIGYDPLQSPEAIIDRTPSGVARVGGFFSNPMTFAHLHALIFFLVAGVSLYLFEARNKQSRFSVFLTGLLGLALLLTFTRGAWIGVFVGFIVMGFLFHRKWGLRILFGLLALGLAAFFLVPAIQERALQFMSSSSYDSERVWIWKANWQMFLDHPIFGVGYGENTQALPQYYKKISAPEGLIVSHSHNQFLNILSGLGILGFLSYLWVFIKFLSLSWKAFRRSKSVSAPIWLQGLALGAFTAQISFLVGGLTESNFEHSKVRYVLLIVWALPLWIMGKVQFEPDH